MHGKRKEREQVWSFAQEKNIQKQFGYHIQLQTHIHLFSFFLHHPILQIMLKVSVSRLKKNIKTTLTSQYQYQVSTITLFCPNFKVAVSEMSEPRFPKTDDFLENNSMRGGGLKSLLIF